MNRFVSGLIVAVAFLPIGIAQDRPILPPGPAPGPEAGTAWLADALFVQANMIEGGQVMFLVQRDEPDPNKLPPPPDILVRVDGKAVRAVGADRKPLDVAELNKRLSLRAAAVVVHGQAPDPFFLKVLNDRSVVFVVTKKLFDQLAKAAAVEMLPGWWCEMKPGQKLALLDNDNWQIGDKRITVNRGGKLDHYLTYKADATDYPKTIDLTPDRGPAKGKVLKGIYELDGNSLTICYVSPATAEPERAERPREIGAKGTETVVFARLSP